MALLVFSAGYMGSSPLARGLPGGRGTALGWLGIIPARAGFTRGGGALRAYGGDHPRSRGVYRWAHLSCDPFGGSSPLARGLRSGPAADRRQAGIIPARAGFTAPASTSSTRAADHPRSRGVYGVTIPALDPLPGSSPLARGLRVEGGLVAHPCRIIPARAGFTPATEGRTGTRTDHPRSRGVYSGPLPPLPLLLGSSPLARGLLELVDLILAAARIIPARAGFTARYLAAEAGGGDHPRSRGVYALGMTWRELGHGSSPLARGLPRQPHQHPPRVRIIPARAGFTTTPPGATRRTWDHPRSRGVYVSMARSHAGGVGSSPLARGLRVPMTCWKRATGIIPARAGFTP